MYNPCGCFTYTYRACLVQTGCKCGRSAWKTHLRFVFHEGKEKNTLLLQQNSSLFPGSPNPRPTLLTNLIVALTRGRCTLG